MQFGGTPHLIGRSIERLEAAREAIAPGNTEKVLISSVDCSSEESVVSFFDRLPAGSFDHIVCTLGEGGGCSDIRGSAGFAGLKRQFDLKFFTQMLPVSLGIDKLADGGSVVLTSGALSRRPGKGSSALSTANAALEAIVKGLANDFGPRVRVNCVSPGLTNTEMWASMPEAQREGMLKGFGSRLPLGRAGESSDVGEAIAMLLLSEYTTGCTFDCDGGASIRA